MRRGRGGVPGSWRGAPGRPDGNPLDRGRGVPGPSVADYGTGDGAERGAGECVLQADGCLDRRGGPEGCQGHAGGAEPATRTARSMGVAPAGNTCSETMADALGSTTMAVARAIGRPSVDDRDAIALRCRRVVAAPRGRDAFATGIVMVSQHDAAGWIGQGRTMACRRPAAARPGCRCVASWRCGAPPDRSQRSVPNAVVAEPRAARRVEGDSR